MPRPEDEYTDEPPRRRPDDRRGEEDYPDVRLRRTGMDAFFGDTNMVLLVFLALCCNGVALILGIVGLATCKDPQAKQNALVVTIIGAIITALGVFRVALRHM
jgi:hypothetical protein